MSGCVHQTLHVIRLPVLNEEVHEEDGDEQHNRLKVSEEQSQIVVGSASQISYGFRNGTVETTYAQPTMTSSGMTKAAIC